MEFIDYFMSAFGVVSGAISGLVVTVIPINILAYFLDKKF